MQPRPEHLQTCLEHFWRNNKK